MKRKVKRFDGGGVLRDRYGDVVKSGSGEPVRTRYGSEPKSETVEDIQDYASLGRRAGATSSFGGPKEYITESKETETESEAPKGIASGFSAKREVEESESKPISRSETKPAVAKKAVKKPAPRYEDTGAKIGSQGGFKFSVEKEAKTESKPNRTAAEIRSGKPAAEEKPSKVPKLSFLTPERLESSRKSYYSGFESKPVRTAADIRAGRGMKKGGKVSSASSRADGCAQRGKTRGKVY